MAALNLNRLEFARQRRKLTKKKLAEAAGISPVTLSRISSGTTKEASEETVSALAKVLNYPVEFFYLDDIEPINAAAVSFRSLKAMTALQKEAALASGALGVTFCDWVAERFNLPEENLLDLRNEDSVSAAVAIRAHWGLGHRPIKNLIKLLESKGVRVFNLSEGHDVDAFSFWRDGTPYIFLNTLKSAERSRFDAAHELGHLLMHRHGCFEGRDVEREADVFASNFLIPREDLIANVPLTPALSKLTDSKKRWGVSLVALAHASKDAGLLSDWCYRELCKRMSSLGYRKNEPEPMAREYSVLWKMVLEELWKDRYSTDAIAKALGLPTDELNTLIQGVMADSRPSASEAKGSFLKVV